MDAQLDTITLLNVGNGDQTSAVLCEELRAVGFRVIDASTGTEALRLADGSPELILLHPELRDVSNSSLIEQLKGHERGAERLVVQLYHPPANANTLLEVGADFYLPTTATREEFRTQFSALLALKRRLDAAFHARDEFLAVAAHDLRTPLTAMRLHLQGLRRHAMREPETPFVVQTCNAISLSIRQADRLSSLVDTLLDASRLEGSRRAIRLEPVNYTALLEELVDRHQEQARRFETTITAKLAPGVVGIADGIRLEQVFSNLFTNALKYGEKSVVEVELRADAGKAVVVVRDHGMGITEDARPRIFDRFVRATEMHASSSLGLGLFIARQIVLAHGGTIDVASEPGKGSTFTVVLPLQQHPSQSQSENQQGELRSGRQE